MGGLGIGSPASREAYEAELAEYQAEYYDKQKQPDEVDRGPQLGFGDPYETTTTDETRSLGSGGGLGRFAPPVTKTKRDPIFADQVMDAILALDESERARVAMEMFAFVPGAYRDIDNVFDYDNQGAPTVDLVEFSYAVGHTIEMAARFGPEGFNFSGDENSQYLKILMGDSDMTLPEIEAAFASKRAEINASKAGGGGRVINYIDPVALAAAAKDAFSSVTGRRATPTEQRDFVKQIHGLQASGATGIQVGPRAEAFAQSSAPVEAGAMDYARGAGLLMQAMGL